MPLRAFTSALIVLALALPCAMPCYAWAVDEGAEVASGGDTLYGQLESGEVGTSDTSGYPGSPDIDTAEEVTAYDAEYDSLDTDFSSLGSLGSGNVSYEQTGETSTVGTDAITGASSAASSGESHAETTDELNTAPPIARAVPVAVPIATLIISGVSAVASFLGVADVTGTETEQSQILAGILEANARILNDTKYVPNIFNQLQNIYTISNSIYNRLGNVYDRLGISNDKLADLYQKLRNIEDNQTWQTGEIVGAINTLNNDLKGGNYRTLSDLYDRLKGIEDNQTWQTGEIVDRLATLNTSVRAISDILDKPNSTEDVFGKLSNIYVYLSSFRTNYLDNTKALLDILDKSGSTEDVLGKLTSINSILASLRINYLDNTRVIIDLLRSIEDKDYSANISVDLSPVTSRLDEISRLLSLQGKSSMLDSFLGDFTLPVSSALSAQVQSALQNAFPFCIPAIMKQVLGLLDVEPVAARVDYEIMGATVSLDFSAGGFAAQISLVTSWLCRILFVAMLLACSRNFVFAMPSKGS